MDWLWLAVFVLVPGAGGHALMSWAQRYVDVSVTSVLIVGMPVVAAVAALVFLGEPLTVPQVLGGLVTLVAISAIVRRPTGPATRPIPLADAGADPGAPAVTTPTPASLAGPRDAPGHRMR